VIPAGTRNHFARDLGLDRRDPGRALDALGDAVEIRVDLGEVAGRPFVNNVSLGLYAEIVRWATTATPARPTRRRQALGHASTPPRAGDAIGAVPCPGWGDSLGSRLVERLSERF